VVGPHRGDRWLSWMGLPGQHPACGYDTHP